jgi:hypothetical protein
MSEKYVTQCYSCGSRSLAVRGGTFHVSIPLMEDGFSFGDANEIHTEDEKLQCRACGHWQSLEIESGDVELTWTALSGVVIRRWFETEDDACAWVENRGRPRSYVSMLLNRVPIHDVLDSRLFEAQQSAIGWCRGSVSAAKQDVPSVAEVLEAALTRCLEMYPNLDSDNVSFEGNSEYNLYYLDRGDREAPTVLAELHLETAKCRFLIGSRATHTLGAATSDC